MLEPGWGAAKGAPQWDCSLGCISFLCFLQTPPVRHCTRRATEQSKLRAQSSARLSAVSCCPSFLPARGSAGEQCWSSQPYSRDGVTVRQRYNKTLHVSKDEKIVPGDGV